MSLGENELIPDVIEQHEMAAEYRLDKMTRGLPTGKFRCGCGRIADLNTASSASANPYSDPICCECCPFEALPEEKPA